MRKQIIAPVQNDSHSPDREWLPLDQIATVEITSEDAAHPIEAALLGDKSGGWRAAEAGKQLLRLHFDIPQRLHHIHLRFVETEVQRTQEFVLRYSLDGGHSYQELLRQQWNFSPSGSTSEVEEYDLDLPEVTILEVAITPDISNKNVQASLAELRLA